MSIKEAFRETKVIRGMRRALSCGSAMLVGLVLVACSHVLDVPPPSGVGTADAYEQRSGAELIFTQNKGDFFYWVGGNNLTTLSGLLADELTYSSFTYGSSVENIDARTTTQVGNLSEGGNGSLEGLLLVRAKLLDNEAALEQYEIATEQRKVGEVYALVGYTELLLAEDYCAGVPLSRFLPNVGFEYGMPLTTDSLLGIAEAHFDSALVHAHGDSTVVAFASIGLGRTRLDRGHTAAAAQAVASVPTAFVYSVESDPTGSYGYNFYTYGILNGCSNLNMSNREGGNGLDFVSASDPRLVIDSSMTTCDGTAWYYPVKMGNPSRFVPLSMGIEARLIEAEAALAANDGSWIAKLNAIRTTCTTTVGCASPAPAGSGGIAGLPPLADPALSALPPGKTATDVRIDLLFRERAFWMYGTGSRLGDLRRLVRQYGRSAAAVFPTGPYPGASYRPFLPSYGTDVSFTLPASDGGGNGVTTQNPHYVGCLTSPSTP
jgi:hypothetical protein